MNRTKIEEMLKVAEKEYSSVKFLSDSKSFMKMKIAQAKIQLLTSLLAEDGGEVKECKWEYVVDKSILDGYWYETGCGKQFDYFINEIKDNGFNYCPFCGGKIVASQHTKGDGV